MVDDASTSSYSQICKRECGTDLSYSQDSRDQCSRRTRSASMDTSRSRVGGMHDVHSPEILRRDLVSLEGGPVGISWAVDTDKRMLF